MEKRHKIKYNIIKSEQENSALQFLTMTTTAAANDVELETPYTGGEITQDEGEDLSASTGNKDDSSSFSPSLTKVKDEEKENKSTGSPQQPPPEQLRFLGWRQVGALVSKNFLTKLRTPIPTFFELFSPALMMLVLVAAYSLSEITEKDAKQYTTIEVDIPGPWLDLVQEAARILDIGDIFNNSTNNNGTSGALTGLIDAAEKRTMKDVLARTKRQAWNFIEDLGFDDDDEIATPLQRRRLQFGESDDDIDDNATIPDEENAFGLLNDAQRQVNNYDGNAL